MYNFSISDYKLEERYKILRIDIQSVYITTDNPHLIQDFVHNYDKVIVFRRNHVRKIK